MSGDELRRDPQHTSVTPEGVTSTLHSNLVLRNFLNTCHSMWKQSEKSKAAICRLGGWPSGVHMAESPRFMKPVKKRSITPRSNIRRKKRNLKSDSLVIHTHWFTRSVKICICESSGPTPHTREPSPHHTPKDRWSRRPVMPDVPAVPPDGLNPPLGGFLSFMTQAAELKRFFCLNSYHSFKISILRSIRQNNPSSNGSFLFLCIYRKMSQSLQGYTSSPVPPDLFTEPSRIRKGNFTWKTSLSQRRSSKTTSPGSRP